MHENISGRIVQDGRIVLKRIFTGTDNRIKRRISAVMAGVIVLTTVGTVTALKEKSVEAKETLYSIEKVLDELNTNKSSYDILEIVPDRVSGNVVVKNHNDEDVNVWLDQKMGFLGYYVGGSEPIRSDVYHVVNDKLVVSVNGIVSENTLSESTLRYQVVGKMYDTLKKSDIYDENSGPFSLAQGYAEVRSGEDFEKVNWVGSEANYKRLIEEKTLFPIERSVNNKDKKDFVDIAKGYMEPAVYGDSNANYVGVYSPMSYDTDVAYSFLDSYLSENRLHPEIDEYEDEYFKLAQDNEGEGGSYDPNVVVPEVTNDEESLSANVAAVFSAVVDDEGNKLNVRRGYRAVSEIPLAEAGEDVHASTPVYRWDDNNKYYVYAGTYSDVVTDNPAEQSSENTGDNSSEVNNDQTNENTTNNRTDAEENVPEINIEVNPIIDAPSFSSEVIDVGFESDDTVQIVNEDIVVDESNEVNDKVIEDEISSDAEKDELPVADSSNSEAMTNNIDVGADNISTESSYMVQSESGESNEASSEENESTPDGYYIVLFEYMQEENVSSIGSDNDRGIYYPCQLNAADIENGAQYVLANSENKYGTIIPNLLNKGMITVREDCDDSLFQYEYASKKGEGNFKWLGDEERGSFYRIKGDEVYYRYGIENREWFKRYVFDRDCYPYDVTSEDLDAASKLSVKVVTKLASEVNEYDITNKLSNGQYQYLMIALMAGNSSYCVGGEEGRTGYNDYSMSLENDISPYVYTQIINRVAKYNTPIIADYKIVTDGTHNSISGGISTDAEQVNGRGRDSFMSNLVNSLMLDELSGYNSFIYGMEHEFASGITSTSRYSPFDFVSNNSVSMLRNNGCHFVNKNVYIYNKLVHDPIDKNISSLNLDFDKKFANEETDAGFGEVVVDIESEKMFREADYSLKDKPLTHDWVSEATVIRYIIGYGNSRVTVGKGEVRVLEIEPVNSYDLAVENKKITSEYTAGSEEYNKLVMMEEGEPVIYEGELYYKDKDENSRTIIKQRGLKIYLTQMTTAEFIGHIEDINAEYDMIYIGMNTGGKFIGKDKYVVDEQEQYREIWRTQDWTDNANSSHWNDVNWTYIGRSNNGNNVYEAYEGNYYFYGLRSGNGTRWSPYWYYVIQYEYVPEQGHTETDVTIEETFGGLHHRKATQEDVTAGRATKVGKVITDYNDDNMDGLVYCNVGDMAYITDTAGGSLKIREGGTDDAPEYNYLEMVDGKKDGYGKGYDYINMTNDPTYGYSRDEDGDIITRNGDYNYSLYRTRYNGNDITKEKCEALKDFARAGYPIVLADDFYAPDYDTSTRKGTINQCTVDNSSYMYEAAKWLIDEYSDKNVFMQSYMPKNIFNWYVLNLGKPTIEMLDERSKTSLESTVYLQDSDKSGDGHYYAYYRFKIDSKGSSTATAKYNVGLYIDINADGKFSPTNEGIMFSSIKDTGTSSPVNKTGVDDNGMPIYELTPGNEYEARCKLSGSFVGCLPWCLKVYQTKNEFRRTNVSGYFAVRNNEKKVRILQLKSGSDNWDMAADSRDTNSLFHRLLTGVDSSGAHYVPFTVEITSINKNDFTNLSSITSKTPDGYYEYLKKNYDMLVMGYQDCYNAPNETVTQGIKKYIDEGYSVLFTHDCTSFVNNSRHQSKRRDGTIDNMHGTNWGYTFNSIIRNIVGMDRYDIMDESTHENEKPYKPRSNRKLVLDLESHGYTYHIVNFWGYQKEKGFDGANTEYRNANVDTSKIFNYTNLFGMSLGNGQFDNEYVGQVNQGQITQYPYRLLKNFNVTKTHGQYYQLDLTADDDHDGESDIVVWYCINSVRNNDNNVYCISPLDVRNNYYIYNKGNITYSGVGHSKVTGEEEMKLFINTMVAAYRTGLHAPDLAIVDSYDSNARKARNLYVSYDDQIQKMVSANATDPDLAGLNKNSDIDNYVELYFTADQVSLVQNASAIDHNLYAKVFYSDDASTESLEYTPDSANGNYYLNGRTFVEGRYKRVGNGYQEVASGEKGDYAKIENNYYKCNFRKIREFEDNAIEEEAAMIRVTELPLTNVPDTAGYISREDGSNVEIMDESHIDETFKRENFTSESEYAKFMADREHIIGCAKLENGVTYKVRIPVDGDNMWGGIDKSGDSLRNVKAVYVIAMDFASYRNNQISTDDEEPGESTGTGDSSDILVSSSSSSSGKKGKIYKVDMTKWRAEKANISRVEVFDLD